MDLATALLSDRSKANIQRIADHIGGEADRFAEVMDLVIHGSPRVAQLASWPMSIACEARPELGAPWIRQMLELLERPVHPGVHRNVIRALQFCPLPKPLHGRITGRMFSIIPDPAQPIASRAFSITVAMRMVGQYPGLASEFRLLLEDALRKDPGPAVRSRTSKALKVLARQEFIDPTTPL